MHNCIKHKQCKKLCDCVKKLFNNKNKKIHTNISLQEVIIVKKRKEIDNFIHYLLQKSNKKYVKNIMVKIIENLDDELIKKLMYDNDNTVFYKNVHKEKLKKVHNELLTKILHLNKLYIKHNNWIMI